MRYRVRCNLPVPVVYEVSSRHRDDVMADTRGKTLCEAVVRAVMTLDDTQLLELLDRTDPDVTPIDERADDDDRGAA